MILNARGHYITCLLLREAVSQDQTIVLSHYLLCNLRQRLRRCPTNVLTESYELTLIHITQRTRLFIFEPVDQALVVEDVLLV